MREVNGLIMDIRFAAVYGEDEIELKRKDPNARLLSDYAFWFYNW